jgi:F-type H+-transporting ATPase subunit gamma
MTRRHEVEEHLRSLKDISEIMGAMKSLSLMETRKLARFLSSQHQVVQSIQAAGADFLKSYPELSIPPQTNYSVYILIGSERGFCGDFNEKIVDALNEHTQHHPPKNQKLILVGSKLSNRLESNPYIAETLDGPAVGQEVDAVLARLVNTLTKLDLQYGPLSVSALYHEHGKDLIQITPVLPPFQHLKAPSDIYAFPPRLNLPKETFFQALVDHYLFAALNEMFYTSLMAEHYRRVQHLEGAIDRLEERASELDKKRNVMRQEEITEEIEVIMLSAGVLGKS